MIRSATPDDVPAILGLIHANNDHLLERSAEEIHTLLPTFWVAEVDGEVVGCCCLEVYSRKIAEVRSLVVKQEMRRRGIGKQLVREAVAEARRRNIAEILTVTGELDFFQNLGFHTVLNEKYALFWNEAEAAKNNDAAEGNEPPSKMP
jgi:amino-acid N-acetyltransferase